MTDLVWLAGLAAWPKPGCSQGTRDRFALLATVAHSLGVLASDKPTRTEWAMASLSATSLPALRRAVVLAGKDGSHRMVWLPGGYQRRWHPTYPARVVQQLLGRIDKILEPANV